MASVEKSVADMNKEYNSSERAKARQIESLSNTHLDRVKSHTEKYICYLLVIKKQKGPGIFNFQNTLLICINFTIFMQDNKDY